MHEFDKYFYIFVCHISLKVHYLNKTKYHKDNKIFNQSSFLFADAAATTNGLNNFEGNNILNKKPAKMESDPRPTQIRCSSKVNGTVLSD